MLRLLKKKTNLGSLFIKTDVTKSKKEEEQQKTERKKQIKQNKCS